MSQASRHLTRVLAPAGRACAALLLVSARGGSPAMRGVSEPLPLLAHSPSGRGPLRVDTVPAMRVSIGASTVNEGTNQGVLREDHTAVVITANGRQVSAYDSTGHRLWERTARANHPEGYQAFTNLLHGSQDRIQIWDAVSGTLTEVDARGRPNSVRRLARPAALDLGAGGRVTPRLQLEGRFPDGRLLATVWNPVSTGSGVRRDSTPVFVIDTEGQLSLTGRILQAERFLFAGGKYAVMGDLPFGRKGRLAVAGTSWFYSGGDGFTVERHAAAGAVTTLRTRDRARTPVDPDDIRASRLGELGTVEARLRSDMVKALAWMPYPDSMPAYAEILADELDLLWARVFAPDWEPGSWDVLDQQGRLVAEVGLPAGTRILDIRRSALLAYRHRNGADAELLVYRITRD